MQKRPFSRALALLLVGDALTLALVTLVGLGVHAELDRAATRLWPNFLSLWAGWLLVAPHLQAYQLERAAEPQSLWRPFWAMVLAAPFGLWLRSYWLGTVILPVFVLVMGGISALAILVWRALYLVWLRRFG